MFDLKPNIHIWRRISTYAILGMGAAWNTVSYNETATGQDVNPASRLSLSENTTSQLAWDFGAGFSFPVTDNLSLTAEYIYTLLGNGSPGSDPDNDVSLTSSPSFSLQTQSLLFGLSLKL